MTDDEAEAKGREVDYLLMRLRQRLLHLPNGVDIVTFLQLDGNPPQKQAGQLTPRMMEAVDKGLTTPTSFVEGERPVFLQLLKHKIDLSDHPAKISPWAVITNDQRGLTNRTRRVYTQYVFRVEFDLPDPSSSVTEFLTSRVDPYIAPVCLPHQLEPEDIFHDKKGRKNLRDILAWLSLRNPEPCLELETARCTRGFNLL